MSDRIVYGAWRFLLTAVFCTGAAVLASESVTQVANRWAFIIEAISPDEQWDAAGRATLETLRDELNETGILSDHIIIFSQNDEDPARRPTSENLRSLLDAIRNPDRNRLPQVGEDASRRLRMVDGSCELQIYLTAGGVTDRDQTNTWIVPSGVDAEEIVRIDDELLIQVSDFEDALIQPDEGQLPLERTLFVVNFISLHSVTRGNEPDSPLREIDITQVPVRGSGTKDVLEDRFLHMRILTKNESLGDKTAASFYQTLQKGLHGYADISGDQDGTIQAEELAQYLEANGRRGAVEIARNGNDPFPLARSRHEAKIPDGLFDEIRRTFTLEKYKQERDSARDRQDRYTNKSKGVLR